MIWEKILTDNDGQYAEIQSGRLFNQNALRYLLEKFIGSIRFGSVRFVDIQDYS